MPVQKRSGKNHLLWLKRKTVGQKASVIQVVLVVFGEEEPVPKDLIAVVEEAVSLEFSKLVKITMKLVRKSLHLRHLMLSPLLPVVVVEAVCQEVTE